MLFRPNRDPTDQGNSAHDSQSATSVCHIEKFTTSSTLGTASNQPLFHAVSSMGKNTLLGIYPSTMTKPAKFIDLITTLLPGLQIQNKPLPLTKTGIARETTNATQPKTPIISWPTPVPPNRPLRRGCHCQRNNKTTSCTLQPRPETSPRIQAQNRIEHLGYSSLHLSDSIHYHLRSTTTNRPIPCFQAQPSSLATIDNTDGC